MENLILIGANIPFDEQFEPEDFRALIYGAATSQSVRWWRAEIDPSFDPATGIQAASAGKMKWLHTESDVSLYRALISDSSNRKRYFPQGVIEVGDMTIVVMPDEIAIGDHDWVMPIGRANETVTGVTNARLLQHKVTLTRGTRVLIGAGIVSSSGTAVVGSGTTFTTTFNPFDVISAAGTKLRIAAIIDDTHLTLESVPITPWSGNNFSRLYDAFLYYPVWRVDSIVDASTRYVENVDYKLAPDGRSILWLSVTRSPAAGAPLSCVYSYYPKYEVLGDLGTRQHGVGGVRLPQTNLLRLVKPDSITE